MELNWLEKAIVNEGLAKSELNLSEAERIYEECKQREIERIAKDLKKKELLKTLKQKQRTCPHKVVEHQGRKELYTTICLDCGLEYYE